MKEKEIVQLFNTVVQDKVAMKKLGASKDQVYNWRNPERKKTSIGSMLEVLWQLGHLKFESVVVTDSGIIPISNNSK